MKKTTFILMALAIFTAVRAQDTLSMFDTFYMHRPIAPEILSDDDCKDWNEAFLLGRLPLIQMYTVTRPTTIYGVAATPFAYSYSDWDSLPSDVEFLALENWDSIPPDVELTAIVFAKEGPGYYVIVDSVRCRPTPYYAYMHYQSVLHDVNGSIAMGCWYKKTREYLFERPCTVNDTCFVGIRWKLPNGYSGLFSPHLAVSNCLSTYYDNLFLAKHNNDLIYFYPCDQFYLVNGTAEAPCEFVISVGETLWGGTFPIVGFHCTTPPQNIRREEVTPDHCTLAWDASGGGIYEVAVGPYGASPDTVSRRYVTTDTVLRIDSLEYGTLYSAWVRGQCRYTTAAYDTVLWSNWGSTYISLPLDINEANAQMLDVAPNPTDGTVHIGADGVREVWCIGADGRRSRLRLKNGRVSLRDYPAGIYALEIHTDEGIYTTRVVRR